MQVPYFQSDSGGARTLGPLIKSQLLCQLSYGAVKNSTKVQHQTLQPNFFCQKSSIIYILKHCCPIKE